jgi:hypothetical protein
MLHRNKCVLAASDAHDRTILHVNLIYLDTTDSISLLVQVTTCNVLKYCFILKTTTCFDQLHHQAIHNV